MATRANPVRDTPFEIVAQGFQFCEAPRADADGRVCFSDLTGGGYYRSNDGTVDTLLADRLWIGGATFDEGDAVLLSGKGGLVLVQGGEVTPILTEIGGKPVVAVNDIEADAEGAIYGGTLDFGAIFERGEVPSGGILFRLAPSGELSILRDDVVASNGIGFSPDGAWMYHSESTVGIWAWPLRDGIAAAPPILIAPADDCDGLAVDEEGGIWVAFWREALLRRYRPDGTVERTIRLPFPNIVSLTFGGPERTDLYVTTGGDGQGGVIRIRSDIPGLATHRSRFTSTVRRE
jgi:sugar lactone lactonase YvrE